MPDDPVRYGSFAVRSLCTCGVYVKADSAQILDCGAHALGGTAVVIPCFNEEGRVGEVVRSVRRVMGSARIVVVDDASSDGSAEEARRAGATVLVHGCNQGYGAALETGYLFALRSGCSVVVQMDADGQHIAGELPKLLGLLGDGVADLADAVGVSRQHAYRLRDEAANRAYRAREQFIAQAMERPERSAVPTD